MFSSLFNTMQLVVMLLRIPALLLAITVHESAHGLMASKLGDPTARALGRISLNPLRHLDPVGTICLILFGFGWARPVPVNTRYFKNPKRDMALTALAGPAANLLLGFIGMFFYMLIGTRLAAMKGYVPYLLSLFLYIFYILNISLAVFNLLPIPPLDGSRLLLIFLPDHLYFKVMRYERTIQIVMLILLWVGVFNVPLQFGISLVENGMKWLLSLLPFI